MFKLKQSNKDSMWYWSLSAANGEIICQSEGYTSSAMAVKGMASIVVNAAKLAIKKALGLSWYTIVEDTEVVPMVEEQPTILEEPVVKKKGRAHKK